MPFNTTHISYYQITQEKAQNLEEIERVFLNSLKLKNEIVWQNYLISIAYIKLFKGLDFTDNERKYLAQAQELYPNNTLITTVDKIMNYGGDLIILANEYDSQGNKYYIEKNYQKSIDNWKQAIEIIPNNAHGASVLQVPDLARGRTAEFVLCLGEVFLGDTELAEVLVC